MDINNKCSVLLADTFQQVFTILAYWKLLHHAKLNKQHRESNLSKIICYLKTNIISWWKLMRLDWREIEDRLFVVRNLRERTLTLAIWESLAWTLDSRSWLIVRQSDYCGLSLQAERGELLLTWDSEIENNNLQIMSTLAKECGAKSQDGFTEARLAEFMPPSFDCQWKTLQNLSKQYSVQ